MNLDDIKNKWVKFVSDLNSKGIPLPMLRDPKNGNSSVSLTFSFIAFNLWLVSIIGKASGLFGGVNPDQAFNMTIVCFSLYFGRSLTINKTDKNIKVENKDE